MPRTKLVARLEELCLNVVTADYEKPHIQDELSNLPPMLINNIFERLCLQYKYTKRRFPSNIFIHPWATSLRYLEMFDEPNTPLCSLHDRISEKCKNLVDLSLTIVFEITRDPETENPSTVKLLQSLPKLERLNLRLNEQCTDEIVFAITQNCLLLTHFNVSWSCNVTDAALQSLSRCAKLKYLNIEKTGGTVETCLFLLDQLPLLKEFVHSHWPKLLTEFAQLSNTKTLRTYSIESITMQSIANLAILRTIFPNLRHLKLMDFPEFLTNVDFDVLVWPQRLTSLQLHSVQPVDIRLVDRAWPMLEKLTLRFCTVVNQTDWIVDVPLKNLRQLCVSCFCSELYCSESEIRTLLMQCKRLEKLCICSSVRISDNLFLGLIEANALQCLEILALPLCHSITTTSILKLLEMKSPLKKLFFFDCEKIDALALDVIDLYIKSNNLDVQIENKTPDFMQFHFPA